MSTLVEHWDGVRWRIVASPNAGAENNDLTGVSVASASDAWAVGSFTKQDGTHGRTILHWDGSVWTPSR